MRLAHGNQAGSFPFAVPAFSLVSKGIFMSLGSSLLYGFAPVICSFSYQLGNNPYTMAFLRSVFVIPVLHVLCHVKGIGYSLPLQRLPDLLGRRTGSADGQHPQSLGQIHRGKRRCRYGRHFRRNADSIRGRRQGSRK